MNACRDLYSTCLKDGRDFGEAVDEAFPGGECEHMPISAFSGLCARTGKAHSTHYLSHSREPLVRAPALPLLLPRPPAAMLPGGPQPASFSWQPVSLAASPPAG